MIQSEPEVCKVNRNSDVSFCFALSPVPDYVKATVETVLKIHETEDDGDVLVFLTGQVSGCIFNSPTLFVILLLYWRIFFPLIISLDIFFP